MVRSKSPTIKPKKIIRRKSKSPNGRQSRSRTKSNDGKRNIGLGDNWVNRLE